MTEIPPFLRACARQPTAFTPVWLMRQAGRYMPEYRALRARHGFLELCKTPAAAAEATLQPVDKLGVDAAILFADILLVLETVRLARKGLSERVPLIGFAGAPFTLASYLIEGGPSREFLATKRFMREEPAAWHALMTRLADITVAYVNGQIAAGVQAVQLFDSWVGTLSPADYRDSVLPHSRSVIERLQPGIPIIHFGTGTAGLLSLMKAAGGDVIGL